MSDESSETVPRRTASSSGRRVNGLLVVIIATAIAGALGYIIQAVAGFGLDPAEYATFGIFWAALYLIVGGVSGIQQEVSRASHPPEASAIPDRRTNLFAFAITYGLIILVVVWGSSPLWAVPVFGTDALSNVFAIGIGAASYAFLATVCGVLYGRRAWIPLAIATILDPALRLVLLSIALGLEADQIWIDLAIVLPIPLTVAASAVLAKKFLPERARVDVPLTTLLGNSAKTIVGATATAVLVSGLPLFVGASAASEDAAEVGALIFNITITRAPLVIPFLALQSYLIVYFRESRRRAARALTRILLGVLGLTALASLLAGLFAPAVIGALFGPGYELSGLTVAALVASAGLTGALCVTGPAAIARSGHLAFLAGWVVAALTLIAVLFTPFDLVTRTIAALALAPTLGLIVHLGYLVATRLRRGDVAAGS
ncbi:hypothetical protein [Agromyces badenianii]|uniref:hypothetical protein n=1 Tax=Agromyces badenianii TaxID=2080742 RepID=UPI000D596CC0|nr:hypothetical protein [Agromyces badenianii]PWC03814.1 hypothetical protein DCE94_06295 [Agromyces badenianii]